MKRGCAPVLNMYVFCVLIITLIPDSVEMFKSGKAGSKWLAACKMVVIDANVKVAIIKVSCNSGRSYTGITYLHIYILISGCVPCYSAAD